MSCWSCISIFYIYTFIITIVIILIVIDAIDLLVGFLHKTKPYNQYLSVFHQRVLQSERELQLINRLL